MRKLWSLLICMLFLQIHAYSQQASSPGARKALANEEIKSKLIRELRLTKKVAEKVVEIEMAFHSNLEAVEALGDIKPKEKEIKLNEAHVTRRAQLAEVSLTGREMEDVIAIVENIRRKYKL